MSRIAQALGPTRAPLLLALILGAVTFAAMLAWLPSSEADPQPVVETSSVLVAARDLSAGQRVEEDSLRTVEVPASAIAAGALTSKADAVGLVLRYPVSAGEQVLASKLVGAEASRSQGLSFVVPEGLRAVSVPVTEVTGAGGLIVPGDRVDVMAAVKAARIRGVIVPEDELTRSQSEAAVVTIVQDALVLAVGQSQSDALSMSRERGTQRAEGVDPQPDAASITLAVTPEDAQALFMAVTEGSVGLALRSFGDTLPVRVQPATEFEASEVAVNVSTR